VGTLLWDARFSLATAALAGFGRAAAEVGAVMIVGGNIAHVTRTMTTAIALETSRGELALALGVVLLAISLVVNAAVSGVRRAPRGSGMLDGADPGISPVALEGVTLSAGARRLLDGLSLTLPAGGA
jgi:hypothetical protein